MKYSWRAFWFIVCIAALLCMTECVNRGRHQELTNWVQSRGETVQSIEQPLFRSGPYFYMKGTSYYKVTTDKGVYWVKYQFGRTIKAELGGNEYLDIE